MITEITKTIGTLILGFIPGMFFGCYIAIRIHQDGMK